MAAQPPGAPPPPPPPPPGGVYRTVRPSAVTAAASLLFVVGILGALYSLLGLFASSAIADQLEGFEGGGVVVGTLVVLFLILLTLDILAIVAGARVLSLRRSGRTMGIVATALLVGLWIIIMAFGLSQGTVDPIGLFVAVVTIGGGITILVLLGQNRSAFTT